MISSMNSNMAIFLALPRVHTNYKNITCREGRDRPYLYANIDNLGVLRKESVDFSHPKVNDLLKEIPLDLFRPDDW